MTRPNLIKFGVDGQLLLKPRGLGAYCRSWLNAVDVMVAAEFPYLLVEVLVTSQEAAAWIHRCTGPNVVPILVPSFPYPIVEQLVLPILEARRHWKVVHHPYGTTPMLRIGGSNIREIVTVHDLMMFNKSSAQTFYQKVGAAYRRLVFRFIKRHEYIICVSQETARRLATRIKCNVTVLDIFSTYHSRECPVSVPNTIDTKLQSGSYFVHVGGITKHKNTECVIRAANEVYNATGIRTVVLGISSDDAVSYFLSSDDDGIVVPGVVDDETYKGIIAHACAMIFPSLEEGFGVPIVEAAKAGLAIVTSNRAPMCEIAPEGSILVDPVNIDDLLSAMSRLASDHELALQLGRRAQECVRRRAELTRKDLRRLIESALY